MYKVVLVDDEYWMIRGLVQMIDWKQFNMEVVCATDSINKVLEYCDNNEPDILISDINMPHMTGLELIDLLNKKYPRVIKLIISGYDEFSYAKKAVSLKVFEYILKPINIDELTETLKRVEEQLDNEQQKLLQEERLEKAREKDRENIRDRILSAILDGRLRENMISETEALYIKDLLEMPAVALCVSAGIADEEQLAAWKIKAGKSAYQCCLIGRPEEETYMLCVFSKNRLSADETDRICKGIFGDNVVFAGGNWQNSLFGLSVSGHEAEEALAKKREQSPSFKTRRKQVSAEQYREIAETIPYKGIAERFQEGDFMVLSEAIKRIRKVFRDDEDSSFYLNYILHHVFSAVHQVSEKKGISSEDYPVSDIIRRILNRSGTRDEILNNMYIEIKALYEELAKKELKATGVEKAINFIEQRYEDPDLNLNQIAEAANMSVSNLCVKFKKARNETCIDYITRLRIEKAKRLLTSGDDKVFEIAEASGFVNQTYFCTVFKKATGFSPDAYRKNNAFR